MNAPLPPSPDNAAPGYDPTAKQKSAAKTSRIPIKVVPAGEILKKPDWIRVKAGSSSTRFNEIKQILREHKLHTVCEEASCPNIGECFGKGTATFMIMGDKCTRRCPFCDVGHGRPDPLDASEPENLAKTIAALRLSYVVITSVDRDDLRDGGAQHFVDCIRKVRELSPATKIEVLVPDFRGRMDRALAILEAAPPDVMNHNLETVPRLYREARPGADYAHSLHLLAEFGRRVPGVRVLRRRGRGAPGAEGSGADCGLTRGIKLASRLISVRTLAAGESVGYGSTFTADRPMRVGVVACGYADGYPRHAPTGTPIAVAGRRTRTLGRVSMDMLVADLGPVPQARAGDEVELWGGGQVDIDEVAAAAGTIGYELMCALAPRVPLRVDRAEA